MSTISGNVSFGTQTGTSSLTGSDSIVYNFPITIDAGVTVSLSGDITLTTNTTNYFIIGGNGVTFDGSGNTMTISSIANYLGLFQCATTAYTATIQNLGVLVSSSDTTTTLNSNCGWVVQYANYNDIGITVSNCYSTGAISGLNAGGIFGDSSSGIAINCYSTGTISMGAAGGIFGSTSSGGTANNCYSTGAITGNSSGGIFGQNSSSNSTATNCYSTGAIGYHAGGIFASNTHNGIATNCYSTGTISGASSGGIFGQNSNGTATNCYSTGLISGSSAGGIFGQSSSGTALNCYCIGGSNIGPIGTITNCYAALETWTDTTAITTIGDSSTAWYDFSTNVPWLLASFDSAIYNPSSDTTSLTSYTSSDGLFSSTTVYNGSSISPTYNVLNSTNTIPTINTTSGALTFTNPLNTSVVSVLSSYSFNSTKVGYNIKTFTLTGPTNIITSNVSFGTQTGITSLTDTLGDSYSFPITIDAGVTVSLTGDITLTTNTTNYFIIGGNGVTFDGSGNTITISNTADYPGLFQCATTAYTATIQNLGVLVASSDTTTTLVTNGGWVVQLYSSITGYDSNIVVSNCYSNGAISDYSGGIFGTFSTGTATNCYSTGEIGYLAGGIFGSNSSAKAISCYTDGSMIYAGGGIFGPNCDSTATNCYSTGAIAVNAGGIFGQSSSGTASNCYSIGDMSNSSGGIFGSFSSGTATSCYSTGAISGINAGGIFGYQTSGSGTASNCYSTGAISGTDAGGIFGYQSNGAATNCYCIGGTNIGTIGTITNCYAALETWTDSHAKTYLTNVSNSSGSSVWTDIDLTNTSTPYLLTSFNSPIYSPSSATTTLSIYTTPAGAFSTSYSIISLNYAINDGTISVDANGRLTFNESSSGNYVAKVLSYKTDAPGVGYSVGYSLGSGSNYIGYNISNFTLTATLTPNVVPCFLQGTKIRISETEETPLEELKEGDNILTHDGRHVPIQKLNKFIIKSGEKSSPYLVPKGYKSANGYECTEDLYLSPEHGLLYDEVNVFQVKQMGFKQDEVLEDLVYYHLTLPNFFTDHVVANGVVCEAFGGNMLLQSKNRHVLDFHTQLIAKLYNEKTGSRRILTTRKYNALVDTILAQKGQIKKFGLEVEYR